MACDTCAPWLECLPSAILPMVERDVVHSFICFPGQGGEQPASGMCMGCGYPVSGMRQEEGGGAVCPGGGSGCPWRVQGFAEHHSQDEGLVPQPGRGAGATRGSRLALPPVSSPCCAPASPAFSSPRHAPALPLPRPAPVSAARLQLAALCPCLAPCQLAPPPWTALSFDVLLPMACANYKTVVGALSRPPGAGIGQRGPIASSPHHAAAAAAASSNPTLTLLLSRPAWPEP